MLRVVEVLLHRLDQGFERATLASPAASAAASAIGTSSRSRAGDWAQTGPRPPVGFGRRRAAGGRADPCNTRAGLGTPTGAGKIPGTSPRPKQDLEFFFGKFGHAPVPLKSRRLSRLVWAAPRKASPPHISFCNGCHRKISRGTFAVFLKKIKSLSAVSRLGVHQEKDRVEKNPPHHPQSAPRASEQDQGGQTPEMEGDQSTPTSDEIKRRGTSARMPIRPRPASRGRPPGPRCAGPRRRPCSASAGARGNSKEIPRRSRPDDGACRRGNVDEILATTSPG